MISARRFFAVFLFCVSTVLWADVTEVDNNALQKLIDDGVPVVDVRRLDEWQRTGVIDGAHLITFFDKRGRYDVDKWLEELDKVAQKDSPVVLICAGGVRSKNIAKLLNKHLSYTSVHNHTKGMNSWLKEGKAVVAYSANSSSDKQQP